MQLCIVFSPAWADFIFLCPVLKKNAMEIGALLHLALVGSKLCGLYSSNPKFFKSSIYRG